MSAAFLPAFRFLALAAALALSGCMSLSGLGGDSKYACQAPEGVTCDSVSGTYANAVANNLPSQRRHRASDTSAKGEVPVPRPGGAPRAGLPAAGSSSSETAAPSLRSQARYLRLWIKPWEDLDGDLYDQAHVFVQVDQGRWQIEHIQQRIRDAYAPLRPPANASTGSDGANDDPARPGSLPSPARPLPSLPQRKPTNPGEVTQ